MFLDSNVSFFIWLINLFYFYLIYVIFYFIFKVQEQFEMWWGEAGLNKLL